MANPLFGEARADLGDGRELTLHFDFDALMTVEEIDERPTEEMLSEMAGPIDPLTAKPSFRHPRRKTQLHLLYGATRFHHAELTLDACKGLLAQHPQTLLWPMLSALGRFMGKEKEIDEAEAEGGEADAIENPQLSAPGIGDDSETDGAQPDSTRQVSGDKRAKATAGP